MENFKKRKYKKYNKYDVVYADFGKSPSGISGIRLGVIVSCNTSNHENNPQVSIVPLSTKLKENPVHVRVEPDHVIGYRLNRTNDFRAEDIQTLSKTRIRGKVGYIEKSSEIRKQMNLALVKQLDLAEILPIVKDDF